MILQAVKQYKNEVQPSFTFNWVNFIIVSRQIINGTNSDTCYCHDCGINSRYGNHVSSNGCM